MMLVSGFRRDVFLLSSILEGKEDEDEMFRRSTVAVCPQENDLERSIVKLRSSNLQKKFSGNALLSSPKLFF